MKNLMKNLQELGVHSVIITTSNVNYEGNLSIEAKQSVNYQNVTYKQYGDNAEEMLSEIIKRATIFKKMTSGGFKQTESQ